jgi:methyl acetate hydrolase
MANDTMDQPLRAAVDDGRIPGVVALAADRNGMFYQGSFGRRSLAEDTPMTVDIVFRGNAMRRAGPAVT